MMFGAKCSGCGFEYGEYFGHIIPCPRCEVARLMKLINSPETENWIEGVKIEAAHQVERWGVADRAGKQSPDWFWLLGYLAGKALAAFIKGDMEKGKHHIISSSAALLNWHRNATGEITSFQPGNGEIQKAVKRLEAEADADAQK